MEKRLKIGLFIIILAALFVPLNRNVFTFINEKPLKGSFKLAEKPEISFNDWMDGTFQDDYSNYFEDHIGFRNFMVRINSQLQYSLFNKTNAKDVKVGKDNYLYEGGYIRDYLGFNFLGEEAILEKTLKLLKVQKELKKENIDFIVVFAPGKASYFPEYIPSSYNSSQKTLSNYLCYAQQCKKIGLDYIDFNAFFMRYKKEDKYEVYPKGGIHWGEYAVALAIDSIVKNVQQKRNIKMPQFSFKEVSYSEGLSNMDKDISEAMNLLFEYPSYPMPTPQYVFTNTINAKKPRLLVVGDSYASRLVSSPLIGKLFSDVELWYYNRDAQFWYYNKDISPKKKKQGQHVEKPVYMRRVVDQIEKLVVKEELKRFDVVLLLSTETNLYKFDFGFADSYHRPATDVRKGEKDYNYYLQRIAQDPEWMKYIKTMAIEFKIPVDSALSKNALQMAQENGHYLDSSYIKLTPKRLLNRKKLDKLWVEKTKKEAKEKGQRIKEILYNSGTRWE